MRLLVDAQLPVRLVPLLIDLFASYSHALASAFDDVDFVELDRTVLILRG
jgi:predicted nuclease of predicted toxin-antitoxin system